MQAMLEAESAAAVRVPGPTPSGDEVGAAEPACLSGAEALAPADPGPGEETSEPVEAESGSAKAIEAVARSGGEAVVLGCDLEVRERLRFMVWIRRVRAERRAAAFEISVGH
jgi:hypothetical protein